MQLILYPNDILTKACSTAERDITSLRKQGQEMFEIMYKHNGLGLSAPQVGLSNQVFVMDTTGVDSVNGYKGLVINPVIIKRSNLKREFEEGCLSFGDKRIKIKRPIEITVRFKNAQSKMEFKVFKGITAIVFQHEYDHLQGLLFNRFEGH